MLFEAIKYVSYGFVQQRHLPTCTSAYAAWKSDVPNWREVNP